MEKEFVTYEQALVLKELGFDEPCFGFYKLKHSNVYYDTIVQTQIHKFRNNSDLNLYSDLKEKIAAPLKQQVFDYFRNKYNLIYQINYLYNGNYQVIIHKNTHEYMEIIESKYGRNSCVYEIPDNYSYEEAESACIDKLIEIVKEKINHEA
jgi:hypothetical protein